MNLAGNITTLQDQGAVQVSCRYDRLLVDYMRNARNGANRKIFVELYPQSSELTDVGIVRGNFVWTTRAKYRNMSGMDLNMGDVNNTNGQEAYVLAHFNGLALRDDGDLGNLDDPEVHAERVWDMIRVVGVANKTLPYGYVQGMHNDPPTVRIRGLATTVNTGKSVIPIGAWVLLRVPRKDEQVKIVDSENGLSPSKRQFITVPWDGTMHVTTETVMRSLGLKKISGAFPEFTTPAALEPGTISDQLVEFGKQSMVNAILLVAALDSAQRTALFGTDFTVPERNSATLTTLAKKIKAALTDAAGQKGAPTAVAAAVADALIPGKLDGKPITIRRLVQIAAVAPLPLEQHTDKTLKVGATGGLIASLAFAFNKIRERIAGRAVSTGQPGFRFGLDLLPG